MVEFRSVAVTISCTDQRRSEGFYEGVLGARRIVGDGVGCSWFHLGSLILTLMPNAAHTHPATFPDDAQSLLWLEVDNLEAAEQHLRQNDVAIAEYHAGEFLLCEDPDGLLIEIWESRPDDEAGSAREAARMITQPSSD